MKNKTKAVLISVLALPVLAAVVPQRKPVSGQLEAGIYIDGVQVETTTVSYQGTVKKALFRQGWEYIGSFAVSRYPKTCEDGVQARINVEAGTRPSICYYRLGSFTTLDFTGSIEIDDSMQDFALITSDGAVIATSDVLAGQFQAPAHPADSTAPSAYSSGEAVSETSGTEAAASPETLLVDCSAAFGDSEVILDLNWGYGASDVGMSIYREVPGMPASYDVPGAYDVGVDRRIYVADTVNHSLKIFRDNTLVTAMELPERCSDSESAMPFVLRDISADAKGNVYGLNVFADQVVYLNVEQQTVETPFMNAAFNTLWTVDILCDSSVLVRDDFGQNGTRVRRFAPSGETVFEKTTEAGIDFGIYEFTDGAGNRITVTPFGAKEYRLTVYDSKEDLALARTGILASREDPDWETNVRLLGADTDGRVYFWVQYTPLSGKKAELGAERWLAESEEFICRVDIREQAIQTSRIQNTNYSMSSSTAYAAGKAIRIDHDGNAYQLDMDADGYRIIKYRMNG